MAVPQIRSIINEGVARCAPGINEGVDRYAPGLNQLYILLESEPIKTLFFTHAKTLPYTFFRKQLQKNTVYDHIEARLNYTESAAMSLASAVHNIFVACIVSVIVGVTLGRSKNFNYMAKKYWMHTAFAAACTAFSVVGAFSPEYSIKASGLAGAAYGYYLFKKLERELSSNEEGIVQRMQSLWERIFPEIQNRIEGSSLGTTDDRQLKDLFIMPVLGAIDEQVRGARNYVDFIPTPLEYLRHIDRVIAEDESDDESDIDSDDDN